MRTFFNTFKSLPPEQKDYFLVYSWGLVWAIVYFLFTPVQTFTLLSSIVIAFWVIAASIGAVLANVGLMTRNNLLLERAGVSILMIAPIVYALTQVGLFIFLLTHPAEATSDPWGRFHSIFLGLWPLFFLRKRARQLKRRVIESRQVPLAEEKVSTGSITQPGA